MAEALADTLSMASTRNLDQDLAQTLARGIVKAVVGILDIFAASLDEAFITAFFRNLAMKSIALGNGPAFSVLLAKHSRRSWDGRSTPPAQGPS